MMRKFWKVVLVSIALFSFGLNAKDKNQKKEMETVTLGAGCFWCVEAIFEELEGVISVESGFSGGHVEKPSYKEVCGGNTGHAEACQVVFDPAVISFSEILSVFFKTHDPTTLNRQGNDVGEHYRSAIFYHTDQQRDEALAVKRALDASGAYPDPIVTEITAYSNFHKAENYHQDYFKLNGEEPYCSFVIQPKVEKFKKAFGDKLKKN